MAKNQHNAGLHYRPLNQLGLSNFNDYIENPIDTDVPDEDETPDEQDTEPI